jgi:hypothetical protein
MKVQEAKGVCKDRSKWKEVISAPMGNGRDIMYYYVCITTLCKLLNFYKRKPQTTRLPALRYSVILTGFTVYFTFSRKYN